MLLDRLFECSENELLYHYCSAATLQAIASGGTLRFTDINMLNDASEMTLAYSVFEEAATRLLARNGVPSSFPVIPREFFEKVDEVLSPSQLLAHPFITCFSLESDMLGQWRSYADDGRGYAIGFRARQLQESLPVTFLRVLYDWEEQVSEMMVALVAMFDRQQREGEFVRNEFFQECLILSVYMAAFKHPAFAEEKEVRAVHVVNVEKQGKLLKFLDRGGVVRGSEEVQGSLVSFQIRENHLVAYCDIQFSAPGPGTAIREVIFGPKNHSSPGNLSLFLGGLGYVDMNFTKSEAPYR